MKRKEAIKFLLTRSIGNFLLLVSIYGVGATFGPALAYEVQYRVIQLRGIQFEVATEAKETNPSTVATKKQEIKNTNGFAQILAGNKEQLLVPHNTDFSISIPKIGASSNIIPNVDPVNPDEFMPALQKGVAHAKGSVFPGMPGNVYLFAHSADSWWEAGQYNAVFYLLLHMQAGDKLVLFFEGKRYDYTVVQTRISDPNDISLLTEAQGGEERLVLQTCWPPGTPWKRFYVIAKPAN